MIAGPKMRTEPLPHNQFFGKIMSNHNSQRKLDIPHCSLAMPGGILDNPFKPAFLMPVEDILRTLSHICRWNGRGNRFFSVLDHSLTLASIVPPEFAMHALVHDFSEAYISDLPQPIKILPEMEWYRQAESNLDARIWKYYAGIENMPQCVWDLDHELALSEANFLGLGGDWSRNAREFPMVTGSTENDFWNFLDEHDLQCGGEIAFFREENAGLSPSA